MQLLQKDCLVNFVSIVPRLITDSDGVSWRAGEQRTAPIDQICGSHCPAAWTHVVSTGVVCVLVQPMMKSWPEKMVHAA